MSQRRYVARRRTPLRQLRVSTDVNWKTFQWLPDEPHRPFNRRYFMRKGLALKDLLPNRQHRRSPGAIPLIYQADNDRHAVGMIADLSPGGAFLRSSVMATFRVYMAAEGLSHVAPLPDAAESCCECSRPYAPGGVCGTGVRGHVEF